MSAATLFDNPYLRQTFTPRYYQEDAVAAGIAFFKEPKNKMGNAIEVLPTGSGKSLVIALIIQGLEGNTIVLQPSKEILEQNFEKLQSYGFTAGIYSASLGLKQVRKITFATIGSVINNKHLFQDFKNIIIDECDLVNSNDGIYKQFIESLENIKVLGLTATPYRLSSNSYGSMLKFITRTKPRIFKRVIYYINPKPLFIAGHLCPLKYFDMPGFNRQNLKIKPNGSGYTDESIKREYDKSNIQERLRKYVQRLIDNGHKSILVFTQFVDESIALAKLFEHGSFICSDKKLVSASQRTERIKQFKEGVIQVMFNVGVLAVGFDFPALAVCVIGRPTLSLRSYYQWIGRIMRPHSSKEFGVVVDLCGNIQQFGAIEDMYMELDSNGKWVVTNRGKHLTNVTFGEGKPAYLK